VQETSLLTTRRVVIQSCLLFSTQLGATQELSGAYAGRKSENDAAVGERPGTIQVKDASFRLVTQCLISPHARARREHICCPSAGCRL